MWWLWEGCGCGFELVKDEGGGGGEVRLKTEVSCRRFGGRDGGEPRRSGPKLKVCATSPWNHYPDFHA